MTIHRNNLTVEGYAELTWEIGCCACGFSAPDAEFMRWHSAAECAKRQIETALAPLNRRIADLERQVREMAVGGRK